MSEWLSGGAPPCQGGGRGFESRLALFLFAAETFETKGFPLFFALYSIYYPANAFSISASFSSRSRLLKQ